jgi:hypothetical protein
MQKRVTFAFDADFLSRPSRSDDAGDVVIDFVRTAVLEHSTVEAIDTLAERYPIACNAPGWIARWREAVAQGPGRINMAEHAGPGTAPTNLQGNMILCKHKKRFAFNPFVVPGLFGRPRIMLRPVACEVFSPSTAFARLRSSTLPRRPIPGKGPIGADPHIAAGGCVPFSVALAGGVALDQGLRLGNPLDFSCSSDRQQVGMQPIRR